MSAPASHIFAPPTSASRGSSRRASFMGRRQLTRRTSISAFATSSTVASHPVELQVETMSSTSTRVFLYTWYAVLLIALVVESNVGLQWVSRNFCGNATVSAYHLDDWNSSSCLSWESYWVRPDAAPKRSLVEDDAVEMRGARSVWENRFLKWRQDALPRKGLYVLAAWPPAGVVEAEARTHAEDASPVLKSSEEELLPESHLAQRGRSTSIVTSTKRTLDYGSSTQARSHKAIVHTPTASAQPSPLAPPRQRPTMPPLRHVYKLRWTAEALSEVMDRELNRFLHVFVSLASPLAQTQAPSSPDEFTRGGASSLHTDESGLTSAPAVPPWKVYQILVALEETSVDPDAPADGGPSSLNKASLDVGGVPLPLPPPPLPFAAAASHSSSSSSNDSGASSSSSTARNDTKYIYTYRTSVTCWRTSPRCGNIVLPASVVIPANHSRLTITLIDVDAELAEATVRAAAAAARQGGRLCDNAAHSSSPSLGGNSRFAIQEKFWWMAAAAGIGGGAAPTTGVGVMYQRANYTLGTIVFRYLFIFITLLSTLRFLYRIRQAQRMLFEQKWTLALQLGLMLYLNPLYWWCIYAEKTTRPGTRVDEGVSGVMKEGELDRAALLGFSSSLHRNLVPARLWQFVLYYIEFHIPTYFVALTVCYIWGVIAGSFRWSSTAAARAATPSASTTTATAAAATPSAAPPARVEATAHPTDPANEATGAAAAAPEVVVPLTLTVSSSKLARRRVRVVLLLFMLAVVILDTAKCFLEEKGPMGGWGEVICRTPRCLQMQHVILYVLVGGILSSGVGLYWLRRNLARHPYLSTRPQQLACRIIIFIYFTGGFYCVVQVLLLETFYAQLMAIIYYQPFVQLSHLFVLTSFVNHMTYVYTTTQSSLQIPLRPSDPRWKTVGWSSRWYRWLDWHGGSLYVFFNEAEERKFFEIQVAYQLAKRERKERRKRQKKDRQQQQQQQREEGQPQQQHQPQRQQNAGQSQHPQSRVDDVDAAVAAPGHGTGLCCAVRSDSPSKGGAGKRGGGDDQFLASTHQNAPSRSLAASPVLPPPRAFAVSANTLSELSDAEDAIWHLQPPPERHRSLSTLTEPSSNTSESNEAEHEQNKEVAEKDGGARVTKSDDTDHCCDCCRHDGKAEGAKHTADSMKASPCRTPAGDHTPLSPFRRSAMPSIVTSGVAVHDGGPVGDCEDSHRATTSKTEEQRASHRVLSCVSSRMLVALHGAESRLVDGTATFVDLLAENCVDRPLRVLLRQRARQRFVFFNLETAIDCLNLSREAYAVQESRGDDLIRTGIQVDASEVPRAALTLMERAVVALFGLCFKKSPLEPPVVNDAAVGDGVGGPAEVVVTEDGDRGGGGGDADAEAATSCESDGEEAPLLHRREARSPVFLPSSSPAAAGVGASTPPRQKRCDSPTHVSATPAYDVASSPSSRLLPHMNVEQYGYSPVAVFDTRGVQVVVARMDVSGTCPVHLGKHPRLTIAFRGTDNVANVLEDIRFRRRTWKEMETPTLLPRAQVHSGFLELWMSLKEAVMGVVLKELRSQCESGSLGAAEEATEGAEAATATPSADNNRADIFHSEVPFPTRWTAPTDGGNTLDRRHTGFLRIYVTGHSLGGALACLCAYSLRRMLLLINYPEPDLVVYTFGQPRIGNSVFKQHYNRAIPCTFRVVNESDVVSGFNILGGHHVGVQVNVDRHGNYICKPMYIERLLRPTRGQGLALLNHKLAAYANSLNAVADVYADGACPVRCLEPYLEDIESVSSTEVDEEAEREEGDAACTDRPLQREEVEAAEAPL